MTTSSAKVPGEPVSRSDTRVPSTGEKGIVPGESREVACPPLASNTSKPPIPWQIWLAYLRFADHPEIGKVRPVVVLENNGDAIVAAKVTTAQPQPQYSYCELADWQAEGLLKPSRVQTMPLFRVPPKDLLNGEPLGMLSEADRKRLIYKLGDE